MEYNSGTLSLSMGEDFYPFLSSLLTKPQLNQTKQNNQQINESWVLHKNDFAPTPATETLLSALQQYRVI